MIFTKVLQKCGGGIPSGHTKNKAQYWRTTYMAHSIVLVLVLVYILLPFYREVDVGTKSPTSSGARRHP